MAVALVTVAALAVAARVYVIVSPDCARFAMPVTRFAAVVDKLTEPSEVAPVGAARFALRVTPDGIAEPIAPVIFEADPLVVTAKVVVASVAEVGWLPATAELTVKVPGLPDIETARTLEIV